MGGTSNRTSFWQLLKTKWKKWHLLIPILYTEMVLQQGKFRLKNRSHIRGGSSMVLKKALTTTRIIGILTATCIELDTMQGWQSIAAGNIQKTKEYKPNENNTNRTNYTNTFWQGGIGKIYYWLSEVYSGWSVFDITQAIQRISWCDYPQYVQTKQK